MTRLRPFALNQFTTKPQSFEADLQLMTDLSISELELCQFKLDHDAQRAAKQLQQLDDAGISVTSVQSTVHSLFPDSMAPKPKEPAERLRELRNCIDLVTQVLPATAERHVPFVLIGGVAPEGNFAHAQDTLHRLLSDLIQYAADKGVKIAFETLHPVLMNQDTFIHGIDPALELYQRVDHPSFGLVIDTWHIWPEAKLKDKLAQHPGCVLAVHLSDWHPGGPRRFNDRLIPGTGTIDFPKIFDALDAADYRGVITLEILSDQSLPDSLWRRNMKDFVSEAMQFTESMQQMMSH